MKKVLVTGASGFIGRHCLPFLHKSGYEVYAVSSKDADLLDPSQTTTLLAKIKPTHLLHLAWYAIPGKFWNSPLNLKWTQASIHLLEQFVMHGGKRFVAAGTCAEYDWSQNHYTENALCNPATLYGACKAALHLIANAFCKQNGISFAWGRIFHLYGPEEHPDRFVPLIIQKLLKKEAVSCTHGEQIRDFMHVEDVARAFAALLDSELQGAINIASGKGVKLKEISYKIAEKLGGQELLHLGALKAPANDPATLVANTFRLSKELGWQPSYDLESGLDQVIHWWSSLKSRV